MGPARAGVANQLCWRVLGLLHRRAISDGHTVFFSGRDHILFPPSQDRVFFITARVLSKTSAGFRRVAAGSGRAFVAGPVDLCRSPNNAPKSLIARPRMQFPPLPTISYTLCPGTYAGLSTATTGGDIIWPHDAFIPAPAERRTTVGVFCGGRRLFRARWQSAGCLEFFAKHPED